MFFSALTLAAALQAAPVAAPVAGNRGYLLQQRPFDRTRPLDKQSGPFVKRARPLTPDEARALGARVIPPRPVQPMPRKQFVLGPAPCENTAPEHVGKPEDLTLEPLAKMPMAHVEYAVARTVDGCPVAVLVRQGAPAR